MVKYCDGFSCKKKKRRTKVYRYVKNGTAATQKVPVKAPSKREEYLNSWMSPWGPQAKTYLAVQDKLLGYVPFYNDYKTVTEGIRAKDYAKVALGLGGAAYSIGTHFFPQFKVGNLLTKGISKIPLGKAAIRFGKNLKNAASNEVLKQYKSFELPDFKRRFQAYRDLPVQNPKWVDPTTYSYPSENPHYKFQFSQSQISAADEHNAMLKAMRDRNSHFGAIHTPQKYVAKVAGGPATNKFANSPSWQKYQHQLAKEHYNRPKQPKLHPIHFDVSKATGLQRKPNLAQDAGWQATHDEYGNSLFKGKNPL